MITLGCTLLEQSPRPLSLVNVVTAALVVDTMFEDIFEVLISCLTIEVADIGKPTCGLRHVEWLAKWWLTAVGNN